MRNALIVITLEAIILDLGVAADTAAIMAAVSKNFQVVHAEVGIQKMSDRRQVVVCKNACLMFRKAETQVFKRLKFVNRAASDPALVKIKMATPHKTQGIKQ